MSNLPEKYTNIQQLTPGKNASVFRATNSFLNREVFLKIYPIPEHDPSSALIEPQLIQSLEHDNLVRIFSADLLHDNRLLLEMEIIEGGSIQGLIDNAVADSTWPSVHGVLDLTCDIAHGLSALHNHGLVHRDIKPANIMVRDAADRQHAVVTDLGLASSLDDSGRAFSSRHARLYRPPEVWDNQGYSKTSDVYQTGIVLYQMLGGVVPYQTANLDDADLARITINGELFDLQDIGPHVDRGIRSLISRCICKEENRIQTMKELLVEVQKEKGKHLDWTYSLTDDGFNVLRVDGKRTFRIEVMSMGNDEYIVSGFKRINNRAERRYFSDQTIRHGDLGRSQVFRRLLSK